MRTDTIALIALVLSAPACASMPTKQNRARDAAAIGLVAHPEFTDITAALRRLEARLDTLVERISALDAGRLADREGHREDMEAVMRSVRAWVDELKTALEKSR